jgi:tetratricopeptide (TPR) repeat protein
MGMGSYMEASRTFFQLIKRNPDYYKAYLGIAMSFDKMAKYKDAIRYYKKFLGKKQFSEDSVFARERINELRAEYFSKENRFTLV